MSGNAKWRRKGETVKLKTYPLLQTQMGIFVECLKYPESTQYNLPTITEIADGVDLARLESAIYIMNEVREELRIRFLLDENGTPVQYVAEDGQFCVRRKTMGEAELFDYAEHEFIRTAVSRRDRADGEKGLSAV